MGTFGGMSRIRSGYWLGVREWLLRESKDIPKRVAFLEREIQRTGRVTVEYERVKDSKGNYIATENRLKFSVTPNSSLEKLIKSYIIMGGNPLDISMFLFPNTSKIFATGSDAVGSDILKVQEYPYDGKVSPINRESSESTSYQRSSLEGHGSSYAFGSDSGGGLNVKKYQPPRIGNNARLIWTQEHTVQSAVMHEIRAWANQEIAEKLHLLEHKILKLCDLEEQFRNELDLLAKAFGDSIEALAPYASDIVKDRTELLEGHQGGGSLKVAQEDSERFFRKNSLQWLVHDMDRVFFQELANGDVVLGVEDVKSMLDVIWAYPDFESESVLDFSL